MVGFFVPVSRVGGAVWSYVAIYAVRLVVSACFYALQLILSVLRSEGGGVGASRGE